MPLNKTGKYNDVALPEIPSEPTIVVYQFLDHLSFINPVTKKKQWNASVRVPSMSEVLDAKNKVIPIALAGGVDISGNLLPNEIRRLEFAPDASEGKVFLSIGEGNVPDEELYQYFELCSFNASNERRNKAVTPLFRRIDFQAEAKGKIEKLELEHAAVALALTAKDFREMAAMHSIPSNQSEQLIRAALSDIAKKDPKSFVALSNDPDKDTKVVLAAAIEADAVKISVEQSAIVNTANGSIILQLTTTDREGAMNEFAAFVRNDTAKGARTMTAIKKLTELKTVS